ncbi:MAG: ABC transporter substrate-binding protein [Chloroflexi bacterium]|nr:ABC transporter substrate-binding protein [Chloroflexota bacterium]
MTTISLASCQPPPFECTDAIGCVDIAPGEPIKLGVLQAQNIGPDHYRGVELALATRDNQIHGHPIQLQIENEQCTSEGGTMAALKVVADPQTVAIIGTTCSGAATTASKIMSEAGLAMVSGANTAPSLTSIGGERGADWQPGYLRTSHNEAMGIQAAVTFVLQELDVTRVATINDGDAYTRGFTDVFEQAFTDLGGEIVLSTAVNKGDTDMRPVLTAVAASGAEMIFLPIFPAEGTLVIQQAKEIADLGNIILLGGGALLSNIFIESVGADGVGVYITGRLPPESSTYQELISAYETKYGEPMQAVGFTYVYDAANLLLNAIEVVALQEKDGTLHIGRQALREALYATSGFEGVTSNLTCDQFGDCSTVKFVIVRLDDPSAGIEGLRSNVVYVYAPEQE